MIVDIEVKEHASPSAAEAADTRPILIVPYMWIGDFVRGHSAVRLLKTRFPNRPVDILATPVTAPLIDYMPGIRRAILSEFPRGRLDLVQQRDVARRLRAEHYHTVLVMPRTWKSALAPFLAGIPERTGFVGEGRFVLLNDLRWGERKLDRMIDCMGVLTLPAGSLLPKDWPPPQLVVPPAKVAEWRAAQGIAADGRPAVALCPGAVGPGKQWPARNFAELASRLAAEGVAVWVVGGPSETPIAAEIAAAAPGARDLTGRDLRNGILALAAADTAVANDSGLMHVAAAAGTPPVGLYGPTDPHLYEPLNPVAAQVEPLPGGPCSTCGRPACPVILHRRVEDIRVEQVHEAVRRALAAAKSRRAAE